METREKIFKLLKRKQEASATEIARSLGVSRQYASRLLAELVRRGELVKTGSTKNAAYFLPTHLLEVNAGEVRRRFQNKNLEEHAVLEDITAALPQLLRPRENVRHIFSYAFTELLNNAIEHSRSKTIDIDVSTSGKRLSFTITDHGVGVFRNVRQKRKLKSDLEAIQDILKGKTTTAERRHSGEGIFFTLKMADIFILDSYGQTLTVSNLVGDVFIGKSRHFRGTKASFTIATDSERTTNDVFKKYSGEEAGDFGFDQTEIHIRLYTVGGSYVSRSQARRVLAGLEKFKSIIFDFEGVPQVGQGFIDEIFRVFHQAHKDIALKVAHATPEVNFMISRTGWRPPHTAAR